MSKQTLKYLIFFIEILIVKFYKKYFKIVNFKSNNVWFKIDKIIYSIFKANT